MKLKIPYRKWFITQGFAQNANTYYSEAGLRGHTGVDIVALGDDLTIYAAHDSFVFAIQNKDNPDLMKYRGVHTLIESEGIFYELSYGHCDEIFVEAGTEVLTGDRLATEGNTGSVASNGKKVTAEEKKNGSRKGAHLHLQLRLVRPVEKRKRGMTYLTNDQGFLKRNGMYFERVPNPGFADCIDPMPFLVMQSAVKAPKLPHINITLRYGDGARNGKKDAVKLLQTKLGGITVDGEFGVVTDRAVRAFQKKYHLTADGIVGPKTSKVLNEL